jgi:hypothetical protein
MEIRGLSATTGPVSAAPARGVPIRLFFARKAHAEELLAHFLGIALGATDFCLLFFVNGHLYFECVTTPLAPVFIGWHLDPLLHKFFIFRISALESQFSADQSDGQRFLALGRQDILDDRIVHEPLGLLVESDPLHGVSGLFKLYDRFL